MFSIDLERYRLVDLSLRVDPRVPNAERPYVIHEGRLGDGTYKYDVVNTHTHVGTHVESPWHFYGEGKTCTDYPLEHFMGPAALLKATAAPDAQWVECDWVREQLEPKRGAFDILFIRNETDRNPLRFHMDCVTYLADLGLKLLIFESTIGFGETHEDGRTFHDLLMRRDTLLVEFPANAQALDQDEFFVFAMPLSVAQVDSSACRLFAVVER